MRWRDTCTLNSALAESAGSSFVTLNHKAIVAKVINRGAVLFCALALTLGMYENAHTHTHTRVRDHLYPYPSAALMTRSRLKALKVYGHRATVRLF